MQITIKGRHWKVTPDYREYAERRIEKLQRYFSHLISAQLTVTEEGYRHLAELRIFGNGFDLTGKAQNPDPKAAITLHVYGGEMKFCHVFNPVGEGGYRREYRELYYTE